MKTHRHTIVVIFVTLMLIPAAVFANGYTTPWIGGELSGPAVPNGAGIYWNPASIGAIKGNSFFVTIEPVYEYVSYQRSGYNQNGAPYNRVSFHQWAPIPTLAVTFQLPKNFGFGFGLYTPFARQAAYPPNGAQRFNGIDTTVAFVNATPVVTYKILPTLIIGAGVSYIEGLVDAYQSSTLSVSNPDDENPLYEAKVHIKNNTGSTYGWTTGIYYKPTDNFAAGISYISRTYYTLNGTTDVTVSPQMGSFLGTTNITAKSRLTLSFPQMINIGIHFKPVPNWIVDVTEQWINWSIFKTIHVKLYDASNLLANKEMDIITGFDDTLSSKIWAGYKGFKNYFIAGGVTYDPSGIPLNHIYALNLEFNKMEVFAQVNYDITPFTTVGIGFDHNFIQSADVVESTIHPQPTGLYKGNIEKITMFYNYSF